MIENLYGVYTGAEDAPRFVYVGQTKQTVEQRWEGHVRGARDPETTKPLYEEMRYGGIENYGVMLLDTTEGGLVEADYVRALILEGHALLNANSGNTVVAKPRTKSDFRSINRDALARTSSERRNRLHSEAQVLTKPEIVRQRITGDIPSAAELDAMDWKESWPELMPFKPAPKNPDDIDCQMCKYGDLNIFVALKKGKWSYWVKDTRTATADSYKVNWRNARPGFTRLNALEQIVAEYPKFMWWPLSARNA